MGRLTVSRQFHFPSVAPRGLHKSYPCEDLVELLKESGIDECLCRKLPDIGKDGWVYRSAAFMISCDFKYQDMIYDECTWPAYWELKEWIFNGKKQ